MFGGLGADGERLADAWASGPGGAGEGWERLPPPPWEPREAAAAAALPPAGQIVLCGGAGAGGCALRDVWVSTFDGTKTVQG